MPSNASKASYAPPPFMGKAVSVDANGFAYDFQYKRKVVAKTAAWTVSAKDSGVIFAVTGTGSVTATLPAVASSAGLEFEFVNCADQEFIIASAEGDNIVMFNNAAADSVSITTASEHIGGAFRMVSDGTLWYAFNQSAGANTVTVVDA